MLPSERNEGIEWVVREEAETDWDHGKRPESREIEERLDNGIIILDKPPGPASNQVSVWTKDLLERKKVGHSGTLDPGVTGVLPLGLNQGTKILGPISEADKEYVCLMKLEDARDPDAVMETAGDLVGYIDQVPPEKSAVKREERSREIYYIEILEIEDDEVLFIIGCERGFYVRTFCKQFGSALGTSGSMEDLRRTKVGIFEEADSSSLQEVVDQYEFWKEGEENYLEDVVLPIEAGVRHLKKVIVKDSAVAALAHGADLGGGGISNLQGDIETGETVAVLTLKGELVAIARTLTDTEKMLESDETVAELERVFIQKDLYPREW